MKGFADCEEIIDHVKQKHLHYFPNSTNCVKCKSIFYTATTLHQHLISRTHVRMRNTVYTAEEFPRTVSRRSSGEFSTVEVFHQGKIDFDVDEERVRFENDDGAVRTIVRVEIPAGCGNYEKIRELVFAHLYTVLR